jgi:hypothetical protein
VAGDPRIRASDADRDRAAALLREHHAAGRLTATEFHDRMETALEAGTLGELDELMADLPAIDLYELPAEEMRRTQGRRSGITGGQSLVPRDQAPGAVGDELAEMSAAATAIAAWSAVATVLVGIGVVTAVLVGALVPMWAVAFTMASAIAWVWFLIRRSQR